ncbi:MAG TPA: FMN-binding negative transcriptional regulator [Steroidobacteraceae bacterium]|nr:FMN-binding negative transcriptional regulator [Steroidobacteraceae bacterium]
MYLPSHFNEARPAVLRALMRARPLSTLVTQCESGLIANHVPVQTLDEPAPLGCIRGHIARANPLWRGYRGGTEALAIFQGPQAYISPSLYPSKAETGEVVPTWNYAVVHAAGTLRFIEDPAWLKDFVAGLTAAHEAPRALPWKIDDAPAAYIDRMLGLIVGFEFSITALTGKWKMSQNRTHADRQGVVRGLRDATDADSREIAAMLAALDAGPETPPSQ